MRKVHPAPYEENKPVDYYWSNEIQFLIMCSDPTFLMETLRRIENCGYIVVYANGKYQDKIIDICKQVNACKGIRGSFMGWSKTRNHIIKTNPFDGLNLFIDDSYLLQNDYLEQKFPKGYKFYSVQVRDSKTQTTYSRTLGFVGNAQYVGEIHETLRNSFDPFQTEVTFLDRNNFTSDLRRAKRIVKDLEQLETDPNSMYYQRDQYYRFTILVKLSRYQEALDVYYKIDKTTEWFRLSQPWYRMLTTNYIHHRYRIYINTERPWETQI